MVLEQHLSSKFVRLCLLGLGLQPIFFMLVNKYSLQRNAVFMLVLSN